MKRYAALYALIVLQIDSRLTVATKLAVVGDSILNLSSFLQALGYVETIDTNEDFVKYSASTTSDIELWRSIDTTFYHSINYFDRIQLHNFQGIIAVCRNRFTEGDANIATAAGLHGLPVAFVRQIFMDSSRSLYEQTRQDFKEQKYPDNVQIFVLTNNDIRTYESSFDNVHFLQWLHLVSTVKESNSPVKSKTPKDLSSECPEQLCQCPEYQNECSECPLPKESHYFELFIVLVTAITVGVFMWYCLLTTSLRKHFEEISENILHQRNVNQSTKKTVSDNDTDNTSDARIKLSIMEKIQKEFEQSQEVRKAMQQLLKQLTEKQQLQPIILKMADDLQVHIVLSEIQKDSPIHGAETPIESTQLTAMNQSAAVDTSTDQKLRNGSTQNPCNNEETPHQIEPLSQQQNSCIEAPLNKETQTDHVETFLKEDKTVATEVTHKVACESKQTQEKNDESKSETNKISKRSAALPENAQKCI